jgi:hypothetical protein
LVQECIFAEECLNIGVAALDVLRYLHSVGVTKKRMLLHWESQFLKTHDQYHLGRTLKVDWITSEGALDVVMYLYEHMDFKAQELLQIPHFDIHLITASGNVKLIKYLYKIGLKPQDFTKTPVSVSSISGSSSWGSFSDL